MMTNRNSILRLSRYKSALRRLETLGFRRVFSDNLSDATGVPASRIRKDFSLFGLTGNRKGGYSVRELIDRMGEVLGTGSRHHVVVVGAGKIGRALIEYKGFRREHICIAAGFDANPAKIIRRARVPILPMEDLRAYCRKKKVRIGILAVPEGEAQACCHAMVEAGIQAVLNFAPVRLVAPPSVIVSNVNLETEVENLIYFVSLSGRLPE